MRIIRAFPPNFARIASVFPAVKGRQGILYAWGDTIYNPSGIKVLPYLVAHERVHGMRQGGAIEDWWDKYLHDTKFRRYEEVLAHQTEWQAFLDTGPNCHEQELYLTMIAQRLSSKLYGNMVCEVEAKDLIGRLEERCVSMPLR